MGIDTEDDPHLRWFLLAKNVSKHSDYKIRVGCVIVKGSRPISVGFNKLRYSRLWASPWGKSIHAESSAIKTSGKNFIRNSTAYIYRETKDGMPGLSRPCDDCMNRLKKFGVRNLYYSINEFPYWRYESI